MRWLGSSILAGAIFWSAVFAAPAPTPLQPATDTGAKTWVGRAAEIEAYLRTAPIVRTEETDRGVTRPIRAFFAPGGAIESMVWKELRPGRPNGYYESYKSEIAAYELDKIMGMGMVPPTVERKYDGVTGSAQL